MFNRNTINSQGSSMNLEKNPSTGKILELFGPTVEFLISPLDTQSDFCILRGIIPDGVYVPLHSHADTEDFFVISGELDCLRKENEDHKLVKASTGDYIHVPCNAPHAWCNVSGSTTIVHILTTKKIGKFFQEIGRLKNSTSLPPPTPKDLAHFSAMSRKYGYWNASPK